jgi:hypothetical protein
MLSTALSSLAGVPAFKYLSGGSVFFSDRKMIKAEYSADFPNSRGSYEA